MKIFSNICFAPADEGGGAGAPASNSSPDAGAAAPSSAPTSPSTAGDSSPSSPAPQSESANGGLRDDAGPDFAIPELGGDDLDEIHIPAEANPVQEMPTVPTQPVVPVAPSPAQNTPQQPNQQPQPPMAAEPDAQALATLLTQNREQAITELAAGPFALNSQEVAALQDDAVTAIPRLLAKTHVAAVSSSLTHMANLIPQMIDNHMKIVEANRSAEDAFYSAWPQMNRQAHGGEVVKLAVTYRQMHPQATLSEVIQNVGAMAMNALRIPIGPGASPPQTNGRPPLPAPFVPAMSGSGAPSISPNSGAWDGLGRDFD